MSEYSVGEPIWARMKGYKPWPGKIAAPTRDLKDPPRNKKNYCVFFFGTFNYSWIPAENVIQYGIKTEEDEKLIKSGPKGQKFRDAVDQIAQYFEDWIKLGKNDIKLPQETPDGDDSKDDESRDDEAESGVDSVDLSVIEVRDRDDKPSGVPKRKSTSLLKTPGKRGRPSKQRTSSIDDDRAGRTTDLNLDEDTTEEQGAASDLKKSPTVIKKRRSENGSSSLLKSSAAPVVPKAPASKPTEYIPRPATPPFDVNEVSDVLKLKKVNATQGLKVGVLGLGNIGQGLVKNLLHSGHQVVLWNRTSSKIKEFAKAGAEKRITPGDVVSECDIIFSCLATPDACRDIVFGNYGVISEMKNGKGYVEMSSIDPETSRDLAEAIVARGGRYLEAPFVGSRTLAHQGQLTITACGDKSLFDDCDSVFTAISVQCMYLGENVGNAAKMNLALSLLYGATSAALAEAMALVEASEMSHKDFVDALSATKLASPFLLDKCSTILDGKYTLETPLAHVQKDLRLALDVGHDCELPLAVTAAASTHFENARRYGYGEHDAAAVYVKIKK
ncbi:glyoxylate/succinic semialdehyde reductase 1-like isoform X2 [Varroa jacobsoni]|uniref:Cytokine-like nuclear factor N-PAC n=1 Tax=Varroa destructor TaxID=109461 RepID=A0A7M7JNF5_VARDE|nr:glyoxylate/succinic semialdehyde reductase 1-like isoform X2 [Varroa destructor]XP_022690532.1 glyoxylate/succinic semialdehyde reductase 1-like isoform X2 [Varroa jacobsoni]